MSALFEESRIMYRPVWIRALWWLKHPNHLCRNIQLKKEMFGLGVFEPMTKEEKCRVYYEKYFLGPASEKYRSEGVQE